jgi:UDP-N-acetylmuramate--alanine ligase
MRHVHFIGIGGVGMNGLAQLAARSGYTVTGSDRAYDPEAGVFQALETLGTGIFPQDGSGIDKNTGQVIFSTAIEPDNPDLARANALAIPLLHRAEFLKELIGGDELIAVAGTAGKTTTTGLLGWIFECLQKDPSVYNGAAVLNWKQAPHPGNVRKGDSRLWIIEADESDRSFLNFHPTHSIITNISRDHYELDELHGMFDQFRRQTSGTIVDHSIRGQSDNLSSCLNTETDAFATTFEFRGHEFRVPMRGLHNLENAFCAVRLCGELGLDLDKVRDAVSRFKGIERRLETAGTINGISVIDDYAHNAAKIAAALAAVSESAARVHAYWRPHGYTPLHQGLNELVKVFSDHWKLRGGSIFILPVYFAGGTVTRNTSSRDLVARLNSAGVPAAAVADYDALQGELEQCAAAGDAILGMGARDPRLPHFAKQLVAEWKRR